MTGLDAAALEADGWDPFNPDSYSRSLGQLWRRRDGEPLIGFVAAEEQSNAHMGTVHGAALMTLADLALGYGISKAAGTIYSATMQLNLHFLSPPRIGDFVVCYPEVTRVTKTVAFVRARIQVGDTTVATADGMWKLLKPPG